MKVLIQRVKKASVTIDNEKISAIGRGILIFLGIKTGDTEKDIGRLTEKIINLRIFPMNKGGGKFDKSLLDIGGEALIVSQFTLYGDCSKGRRPSFTESASPQEAEIMYNKFVQKFEKTGIKTQTGKFQAMMDISLVNDGPVTLMLATHSLI